MAKGVIWNEDSITINGERIPYKACIKFVTADENNDKYTLIFNKLGHDRAFQWKMTDEEYRKIKEACLNVNPSCYFQEFSTGRNLSLAYVLLTAVSVLFMTAAIALFFRQHNTAGWIFLATAFVMVLVNIFVKRKFSLMKNNNGDDPKRLKRAVEANENWRNSSAK